MLGAGVEAEVEACLGELGGGRDGDRQTLVARDGHARPQRP